MDGDNQRDKPSPAELGRSERILLANQIAPRGLTKADAAAYCGCSEGAFNTWMDTEGHSAGGDPRHAALGSQGD
ncbi:hypothetical protein GCM10007857_65240 [Bradyrhizobium iriomotense]|uniref:DUF1153 domain-containing protein n=1 Tax=Bradyrhizobium iriomotense TaxID=441950 RepID=A0ABQ6B600_9BRAD|nr:hypothetical protein GCM10007857_65240 [Bradyrhizobium iriomotense]